MKIKFEDWLFLVCKNIVFKTRKNVHDIYQTINLHNAKLQYLDDVLPENFKK